jgi:TonB family protein
VRPGALDEDNHPGSEGKAGVPDAPERPGSAGTPVDAVGAAPNDFLQNVPIGDGTFLNTREYKYAGFFNRVKQRVGEQWRPNDALRQKDPHGHAAGRRRITVLDVVLGEDGRVTDIRVSQSCGIDFLDEEAVAAFERAQPFPNPPTGLFDEDRHVRFRFGFHIDNDPGSQSPFHFGRGR